MTGKVFGSYLVEDANSQKVLVATTVMQKEWVLANCVLAILFLLSSLSSDMLLLKTRNRHYEKMSRADRLWVLMNINIVMLYILVIGPFTYVSVKLTLGNDPYGDMLAYRQSVVAGLNALSVSFLFEGVLVASVKKNIVLFSHHVVFFTLVLAFSLTESLDVLRTGLVLGSLTTWQMFPRLLAVYRDIGIRYRTQKKVAYLSVVVGIVTRGLLGPMGLYMILAEKFRGLDLSDPMEVLAFIIIIACDFSLVCVEIRAVVKHRKTYQKVAQLAQQSMFQALRTFSQTGTLEQDGANGVRQTIRRLRRNSVEILEKIVEAQHDLKGNVVKPETRDT